MIKKITREDITRVHVAKEIFYYLKVENGEIFSPYPLKEGNFVSFQVEGEESHPCPITNRPILPGQVTATIQPDKYGLEVWGIKNKVEIPNSRTDISVFYPSDPEKFMFVGEKNNKFILYHPDFPEIQYWIWGKNF